MEDNLKEDIEAFINQNKLIRDFLKANYDYKNADDKIKIFKKMLLQTNFNATLGVRFANLLQLSNDERNFKQYETEDIKKLFKSLLQLKEQNDNVYVEAANFEWAVMNNESKAKLIATKGMKSAEKVINDLRNLLQKIDNKKV